MDFRDDAVAIVGVSGRFPGASTVDEFLAAVRTGTDLSGRPTPGLELFAAEHFGLSADDALLLDPQQRIFLEEAWLAVEEWGHLPGETPGTTGVFASGGANQYLMHRQGHLLSGLRHDLHGVDYLASRTAYRLGLTGPALTVQSACSGGLAAVALACQSLNDFRCDTAISGGVNVTLPEHSYDPALVSSDGRTHAFGATADGTAFTSGVGIVVLRRLEDALADGDTVHAVVIGSAIGNDGADRAGFNAPSVAGQVGVAAEALAVADVGADDIGFWEGHGSGTPLGDALEITAIRQALAGRTRPLPLGSAKTTVGHLDAAAGPASLIKAISVVRDGWIPVHPDARTPSTEVDLDFLQLPERTTPWQAPDRVVAVSSFGLGGTNAQLIIANAPLTGETRKPLPHTQFHRSRYWLEPSLEAAQA